MKALLWLKLNLSTDSGCCEEDYTLQLYIIDAKDVELELQQRASR